MRVPRGAEAIDDTEESDLVPFREHTISPCVSGEPLSALDTLASLSPEGDEMEMPDSLTEPSAELRTTERDPGRLGDFTE